jgi:hypothetical protein
MIWDAYGLLDVRAWFAQLEVIRPRGGRVPDTTHAVKSAYSQICDFKETTSVVYNGSDRDRTDDLFHAIPNTTCNLLKSMSIEGTESTQSHP